MITPEPSDSLIRSCGTCGNMRRKNGSLKKGLLTATRCLVCTLTTAGITWRSIGASEGSAWPPTGEGRAAGAASAGVAAGTGTAGAGVAWARLSSSPFTAVAAKPPKAAAAVRVSSRVVRRIGGGFLGIGGPSWAFP